MSEPPLTGQLDQALAALKQAKYVVALTGAGISVDSGIPAFRGSQGLWERYDPQEYAHIESFCRAPARVWRMLSEMLAVVFAAEPNAAHRALAEMEADGRLQCVITQNVDGLHQAAGSRKVVEFHGNTRQLVCLTCDYRRQLTGLDGLEVPPRCPDCGAILKPDVVFFGEQIPPGAQQSAQAAAAHADLMLVIGTSAQVYPSADLPRVTRHHGGQVIEINLEPTALTGGIAGLSIMASATEVLPVLAAGLKS
ncbi:MAG: NAD-dependent deacylase [Deltaproteobacteria bacterium]|nr:NAD-dependent deacylase [Deltaproteobacteria bacterium]